MKMRNRNAAFTLLELVVVLAILATVTALAVRSLDHLEDQRRFEAAQRGFDELSAAVIGSPDDQSLDEVSRSNGFVSDMGRLPRTAALAKPNGTTVLDLGELWKNPNSAGAYQIRKATADICIPPEAADPQVLVGGGWRGPYLRLPLGALTLLDAWGNSLTSPTDASPPHPASTGYPRLRGIDGSPLTSTGQDIGAIHVLGANGKADVLDAGYDQDQSLQFTEDKVRVSLHVSVDVRDSTSAVTPDAAKSVVVRVFQPNPTNPAQISVHSSNPVPFDKNPVTCEIPFASGVTIGARAIRAYLLQTNSNIDRVSGVRYQPLRGGPTLVNLTIDRLAPLPPAP